MSSVKTPYIIQRFGEPSTWSGLAALAAGVGYNIPSGIVQDIIFAAGILSVVAAIFVKEGWKTALESGDAVRAVETRVSMLETKK
ncbi:MAG: hypothetical protein ACREBW_10105 [Candidatus Micrarchaeaceae archaeon]